MLFGKRVHAFLKKGARVLTGKMKWYEKTGDDGRKSRQEHAVVTAF